MKNLHFLCETQTRFADERKFETSAVIPAGVFKYVRAVFGMPSRGFQWCPRTTSQILAVPDAGSSDWLSPCVESWEARSSVFSLSCFTFTSRLHSWLQRVSCVPSTPCVLSSCVHHSSNHFYIYTKYANYDDLIDSGSLPPSELLRLTPQSCFISVLVWATSVASAFSRIQHAHQRINSRNNSCHKQHLGWDPQGAKNTDKTRM